MIPTMKHENSASSFFLLFLLVWQLQIGLVLNCSVVLDSLDSPKSPWIVAYQTPLSMEFSRSLYIFTLQCGEWEAAQALGLEPGIWLHTGASEEPLTGNQSPQLTQLCSLPRWVLIILPPWGLRHCPWDTGSLLSLTGLHPFVVQPFHLQPCLILHKELAMACIAAETLTLAGFLVSSSFVLHTYAKLLLNLGLLTS